MLLPLETIVALLYLGALLLEGRGLFSLALPLSPPSLFSFLAGYTFLIYLVSTLAGRWVLHALQRRPLMGPALRRMAGFLDLGVRFFLPLIFILFHEITGWSFLLAKTLGVGESPAAIQLLGILPYPLFCLTVWYPLFPLHAQVSPGVWTRSSYLLHRARYSLFVLALWVPMILITELLYAEEDRLFASSNLFGIVLILLLFAIWVFPWCLRILWGCQPLPAGALRERILVLEEKAGVHFSEIYLWDLGGDALANAAAVGIFPPFRYLFLSRALLRELRPEEVDAVVCHEMGHVRHRHLLFYLVLTLGVTIGLQYLLDPLEPSLHFFGMALGLIFYIRFIFAWFSRRLERQADLFALEIMGTSGPFRRGLERIGQLYGHIRSLPSWHHASIEERTGFLRAAEEEPELRAFHHREVHLATTFGYLMAGGILLSFLTAPETGGKGDGKKVHPGAEPGMEEKVHHYERLVYFLADDARPPLWLAQHYRSSNDRERARFYAQLAWERARQDEERKKAEDLLRELNRGMP